MGAAIVERVRHDAETVVRNQPRAHGSWQFRWRNAKFRRAINDLVSAVYGLTVDSFSDNELQLLERIVRVVISTIDVHVADLGDTLYDTVDREFFRDMRRRLCVAL